jgi:hypothetical protein
MSLYNIMLPPELVRYIYEFAIPSGMSWRTEHHLRILKRQTESVKFSRIQHNYVDEFPDRYCIRDIPSLKKYMNCVIIYKDDDVYNLKQLCCAVWTQERKRYIMNYQHEVYKRVWSPYRSVYVLGRHIHCTISRQAYTRLLMVEAMFANGFVDGNWSGCVPRDAYCTECILNWSY